MQPRVKYITKGHLAGLVRAARAAGYLHQVDPNLVKSIGDDDPPSSLVTVDVRNNILTAEVWTEVDVRRGTRSAERLLDIDFGTYRALPELDRKGRHVPEVKPPDRPQFIIHGRSGPITVSMPGSREVERTFHGWEGGAIVPVLEEFEVRFVRVSWAWRPKEGREIILKLVSAGQKAGAVVLCHENESPNEVGRRCREALSESLWDRNRGVD